MMKISGRIARCCVALVLVLTSVSAHQRLKSIGDLKKIDFGPSVPKHSLVLLHWFANVVDIDQNNIIWLTFDPDNGDYGSHHYGNYEGLLDPLPRGYDRYQYYTIGNLYSDATVQLPSHVVDPPTEYEGENMDRIIIRVREQNTRRGTLQMIDQVYITQHYDTYEDEGTRYDPENTYQITVNLLKQIREFSVRDNQMPLLHLRNRYGSNVDEFSIRNRWGSLACLGLLLYIVIEEKYASKHRNNRPESRSTPEIRQNHSGNNCMETCCLMFIIATFIIGFIIYLAHNNKWK